MEEIDTVAESMTVILDAPLVTQQPNKDKCPVLTPTRRKLVKSSQARVDPEFISYSLNLTLDNEPLKAAISVKQLACNDIDGYESIETYAESCLKDVCQADIQTRSLFFCRGKCLLSSNLQTYCCYSLSSKTDWTILSAEIARLHTINAQETFHLDVSREYAAIPTTETSLAFIKCHEMHSLMKRSFDGRSYISSAELQRIMTPEIIEKLVLENPPSDLEEVECEAFIQNVQQSAPKLLATCIYAQLGIECLRTLLDKGLSDETFPIDDRHRCHRDCRIGFTNFVNSQGGFRAAEFMTPGEHQYLHSQVVIPIHFHPKEDDEQALYRDEDDSLNSLPQVLNGASQPRRNAVCGVGAYSTVYRINLDPDHHKLVEVRLLSRVRIGLTTRIRTNMLISR